MMMVNGGREVADGGGLVGRRRPQRGPKKPAVLFLIYLRLQETLAALCCKVLLPVCRRFSPVLLSRSLSHHLRCE